MDDLRISGSDLFALSNYNLTNVLLYGYQKHDDETNQIILMYNIRYVRGSQISFFNLC